jgi:hypothetical protein
MVGMVCRIRKLVRNNDEKMKVGDASISSSRGRCTRA